MNIEQSTIESGRFAVEYRLRERERFLRTLIGNLPGVVYRCRTDEQFTSEFISDGCLQLTGYTADDLTQTRTATWDEIIHHEDRERVRLELKRLMSDTKALIIPTLQVAFVSFTAAVRSSTFETVFDLSTTQAAKLSRSKVLSPILPSGKLLTSSFVNQKPGIVCSPKICATLFACTNRTGVMFMFRRLRSHFWALRLMNLSELRRMIISTKMKLCVFVMTRPSGF
jgi:hypothetical protein